MTVQSSTCILCDQSANRDTVFDTNNKVYYYFDCHNCGGYRIESSFCEIAKQTLLFNPYELALISHIIGRNKDKWDKSFIINKAWVKNIIKSHKLPGPKALLDNYILWLGSQLKGFGDRLDIKSFNEIVAEVGAVNVEALLLIIEEGQNQRLLCESIHLDVLADRTMHLSISGGQELSFRGWEYFESIKKVDNDSKRAFMAMPFNNDELDNVFIDYWIPAVEKAGFSLERLDDRPTAGSIDDRLRQTIRRSAFLVCELTKANPGAYWESGFAEGIGLPVIYTCKRDCYDKDSHFDVNHHLCVIWETDNLNVKSQELTSIILETFRIS